jgi:hypothetical protein
MKLSQETKNKILEILDSKEFMSDLYEGLDEQKRIELGQFYTPGKICIQMIEKFSWDTLSGKNILDPTVGSGNLLIACLIAGADSDKVYGNEYDSIAVELCRKRINRACDILGKPHIRYWQIHQGNALIADCLTKFGPEYDDTILKELLKRRNGLKGGWIDNPAKYKSSTTVDLFGGFFDD